jgi:hypothetical protein
MVSDFIFKSVIHFELIFVQKAEQKNLKNVQFGQKRSVFKAGDERGMLVKDIRVTKKKITYQDNRKDTLRASQELARPHPWQVKGYERVNSLERLSLEKRTPLAPSSNQDASGFVFLALISLCA